MNDTKLDSKVFYQIMAFLYEKGWRIGNVTNMGNNILEIEVSECDEPLCGYGGIYKYTVLNGEVILLKQSDMWIS